MKIRTMILYALLLLASVLFLTVPSLRDWATEISELFKDPEAMRAYIASYGILAPLVSALLMILQSLVAPLPAFLITFVNGLLFGVWWGAALSWGSAMLGAGLCFYIARYLGRSLVTRLISEKAITTADRFFEHYGKYAVLVARLIPVLSFDVVSYAVGLTGMRFWSFWIATGIGALPATFLYAYLGDRMAGMLSLLFLILGIVLAISFVMIFVPLSALNPRKLAQRSRAALSDLLARYFSS